MIYNSKTGATKSTDIVGIEISLLLSHFKILVETSLNH